MNQQTVSKEKLRRKLKKYLNTFITKNTFTLQELQLLERNIQPFDNDRKNK